MVDFLNYRPRVPFYLHFGKPGLFSKKKPLKVGYSFCQERIKDIAMAASKFSLTHETWGGLQQSEPTAFTTDPLFLMLD